MISHRKLLLGTLGAGLVISLVGGQGLSVSQAEPGPRVFTGIVPGVAVGGYDPVAYFEDGKPVRGSKDHVLRHEGAQWRFSSAERLEAFRANPKRYAPAYGGYCAWAVSQGYTAKGDPKHWKIVNGRLYLNYNGRVQRTWEKNISRNISKGDANWPRLAGGAS